jgi:hypothetical protein
MFQCAGAAMDNARAQMDGIAPPPEQAEEAPEINVEVHFYPAPQTTARGLDVKHNIVVVETTMEDPETQESGKIWVVTELFSAERYAGSESIKAFEQRVGENIMDAMGGSTLNAKLDFSAFGDPRLLEGLQEAQERLDQISGLPVESNVFFVMTEEGEALDHESVIEGLESDSYAVLFSTTAFISNLSSAPFDAADVSVPETYEEIKSPLEGMGAAGGSGGE